MDDLLSQIETFRSTHGIAESTFGRLAAGDTNLVPQLRGGREPRRKTVERVRTFMLTYQPQSEAA